MNGITLAWEDWHRHRCPVGQRPALHAGARRPPAEHRRLRSRWRRGLLVAFLARGHSANSDQTVRRAFHSLKGLAERTGAAIVAVRHLNKSMTTNPLYRGGGSIGMIGAARCGLLLASDPDDSERRILASTKDNLGQPPTALAFRLLTSPGSHVARVVWDGESHWTAGDLLRESASGVASRSLLPEAREWLRTALADDPRAARDVKSEAAEAGFGRNVLYAAAKIEGVHIGKERVASGRWIWSPTATVSEHPAVSDPREVREVREVRSITPDPSPMTHHPAADRR